MKRYTDFLFWLHLGIILAAVLVGYFLPPAFILMIIIIHQIHVVIFGGCLLTNYEKSLHGLPKSADFFQYAIKRILGIKVKRITARIINYIILSLCLLLSIYRFYL